MLRFSGGVLGKFCFLSLLFSLVANFTWAQSETATVSGQVVDPSELNITGAQIKLVDIDRDTSIGVTSNSTGLYTFPNVRPGRYRMEVVAAGFKVVNVTGVTVNVQDHLEQNFKLVVGSVSESITVEGGTSLIDTESATVSTVVDRNFAENLPMNGRSFQTLIELTPGVVLTASGPESDGQFSVNGQRADSNYWMIDGVSANIGMSAVGAADTLSGSLGGFSAQGGTNSLVSVDAMQEFRIQTSTFAPEFGRTPGGQISIVTRSGTNQFHGTAFDYLRNDALDANDWFNGFVNSPPLPKAEERQNDFGGTLSGPIVKNRTFFFFSYEGMRLRLPQTGLSTVPDASFTPGTTNSRQNAILAMQPFFNAFPLPNANSPEIYVPCTTSTDPTCPASGMQATGTAAFNATYSNRSTLNATSLRLDHRLNDKLTLFGRYNYAPSEIVQRPNSGLALSVINAGTIPTQTATLGATWLASPALTNDLRANYSRASSNQSYSLDKFGGAAPFSVSVIGLPSPYTAQSSAMNLADSSLSGGLYVGSVGVQTQRQVNLVDNLSWQIGAHTLKAGVDYRRLTPVVNAVPYEQAAEFADIPSMASGTLSYAAVYANGRVPLILQNLGVFAQDTWRVRPRLTLTYGLRWDIDCSPKTSSGPSLPSVVNFNDLSTLALAPAGTPVFSTRYADLAPRVGLAYQLLQTKGWESVLRGGWGIFYDLSTTQLLAETLAYPFGSFNLLYGGQFPLDPNSSSGGQPAPITPNEATIFAFDPNLKSPYTREWNVAFEQSLSAAQSFSVTYTGAAGRRLLLAAEYATPNANISEADLIGNYGTSDYDALQLQFRRRLADGLQVLASYSWAHSIDTGSTGSGGETFGDVYSPQLGANANRGPSDFDIRHSASVALSYDTPSAKANKFIRSVSQGWSTDNIFQARSAPPVNVYYSYTYMIGSSFVAVRPDVVPGQPFYLSAAECPAVLLTPCPGGKGFNPNAFTNPPLDPSTGEPTRQGDFGRNGLRGFGAWQWDFAVHRDFPFSERIKLQFRAEMFNVLNHPNFGPPGGALLPGYFGFSNQTLSQSLNSSNVGSGAFSPLYQFGGPRSIQLALKLSF
jgi:hypothetical protein